MSRQRFSRVVQFPSRLFNGDLERIGSLVNPGPGFDAAPMEVRGMRGPLSMVFRNVGNTTFVPFPVIMNESRMPEYVLAPDETTPNSFSFMPRPSILHMRPDSIFGGTDPSNIGSGTDIESYTGMGGSEGRLPGGVRVEMLAGTDRYTIMDNGGLWNYEIQSAPGDGRLYFYKHPTTYGESTLQPYVIGSINYVDGPIRFTVPDYSPSANALMYSYGLEAWVPPGGVSIIGRETVTTAALLGGASALDGTYPILSLTTGQHLGVYGFGIGGPAQVEVTIFIGSN